VAALPPPLSVSVRPQAKDRICDDHPSHSSGLVDLIFACIEISRSLTSQFFLYMLNNREINAVMEHEFGGEKRASAKLSMPCNCMPGKSIELPMTDLMTNAKMTDST
jgi:hypothetical protein